MSASREKKQRQGNNSAEKALDPKQQAAAAKRKTKQYTIIGVVIAILVVALLVWDAGFIQRGATAATIGNTDYSSAEVSYYYTNAYQNTAMYAQYGMSSYDLNKDPEDQVYSTDPTTGESITYHDYFRQSALDELTSLTAVYETAIANGYSEADVKDAVDAEIASMTASAQNNGYSSLKQMLFSYYGKQITPAVFRDIVTTQLIADEYLSDYVDSLGYTDDDLNAYYAEHANELDTFRHSYLYYSASVVETTDADGNALPEEDITAAKEQAMADAKALADAAAASLKSGADINDVIAENEPSSNVQDSVVTGSGLVTTITEWMTDPSRSAGDVGVVESKGYGYYVVVFGDRYLDETSSANVRHILLTAETSEGADAPTDEQMAAAKAQAEELLAQWQANGATEDSFAALANEHSTDTGSNTNGGLYENVYPGEFVTNFNNWLFLEGDRQPGDTAVLENAGPNYYGYHVVYYVGSNEGDFKWMDTVRTTLSNAAVTELQEGLAANITVTEQSGMKYVG